MDEDVVAVDEWADLICVSEKPMQNVRRDEEGSDGAVGEVVEVNVAFLSEEWRNHCHLDGCYVLRVVQL